MSARREAAERREHPRGEIAAQAVVMVAGKPQGTFSVKDLSASGACLLGEAPVAPGSMLTLLLRIAERPPIRINARVLRREGGPEDRRFAVTFLGLPAQLQDIIQHVVTTALLRASKAAATG